MINWLEGGDRGRGSLAITLRSLAELRAAAGGPGGHSQLACAPPSRTHAPCAGGRSIEPAHQQQVPPSSPSPPAAVSVTSDDALHDLVRAGQLTWVEVGHRGGTRCEGQEG